MSGESLNGYALSGVVVPEEIIVHFASFVDAQTLLNCRLVCRVWQELVDARVWRYKLQRERNSYRSSQVIDMSSHDLTWLVYYSIFNKDPYGRNLIKNPCGEEGLKHWNVVRNGGDQFVVENIPAGCDEVPEVVGSSSCFVTSYGDCSKEQWIDLVGEGVPPRVMDEVRPAVQVSEWFANRFDCGAVYELRVSLCDKDRQKLEKHAFLKRMMDGEYMSWKEKRHVFWRYPAGVRYIRFHHRGKDNKFWAGHYGSKITGSLVKLTFLPAKTDFETEAPNVEDESSDEDYWFTHEYNNDDVVID